MPLPVGPVMSLTAITAYDDEGDPHEIALAQFSETEVAPARLLLPRTVEGMPALRERQGIEIDYAAGYGADREDVPADLRQALLVLVAYWYEHRDAVIMAGRARWCRRASTAGRAATGGCGCERARPPLGTLTDRVQL